MHHAVFGLLRLYFIYGFCIGCILFIVLWDIVHATFLQLLACKNPPCDGVGTRWISQVSRKYRVLADQATQAQHQLSSISTVYTPLLACRQQCRTSPLAIAPNFLNERSSPQTAGYINLSNYIIVNTFKLHAKRIWILAAHGEELHPLSVVNSMLTKIQSKTWTRFPTLNMLKRSQPRSLNHHHLLCSRRKHSPAPALRLAIWLLSHWNVTLRVGLRWSNKTIPTICLQRVKSTNISSVGSGWRVQRRTMATCWRNKTSLCVSQDLKTGMACRSSWQACQMIRLSGSGNYPLLRIGDGMTITNTLSNSGVKTSSKEWDGWCGR